MPKQEFFLAQTPIIGSKLLEDQPGQELYNNSREGTETLSPFFFDSRRSRWLYVAQRSRPTATTAWQRVPGADLDKRNHPIIPRVTHPMMMVGLWTR